VQLAEKARFDADDIDAMKISEAENEGESKVLI